MKHITTYEADFLIQKHLKEFQFFICTVRYVLMVGMGETFRQILYATYLWLEWEKPSARYCTLRTYGWNGRNRPPDTVCYVHTVGMGETVCQILYTMYLRLEWEKPSARCVEVTCYRAQTCLLPDWCPHLQ